jgi:signal transduction histidine kinase
MSEQEPAKRPFGGRRSVRFRLLAITLLPMFFVLPLLLGIAMVHWNDKFDALLIAKVSSDLTVAHQYVTRILENTGEHLEALVRSAIFRDMLADADAKAFEMFLKQSRQELGLDYLYLATEPDKKTLEQKSEVTPGAAQPFSPTHWPVIQSALTGKPSTAIDIFSEADLMAISPALAARARLDLITAANSVPIDRKMETRGMVIHSASPVLKPDGTRTALVGGILLNRNLPFIDTINDLVYQKASLPEGSEGTATLFLKDVRISTNVRLFENHRALGTRVSSIVETAVLGHGRVWRGSAFVVNDWYISAYEPVMDSFGKRVGMLYVGFLERPFRQTKQTTFFYIIGSFLLAAAITIPILLRWAQSIFLPLERMTITIARVDGGDHSARTGLGSADDEITRVARHLDGLLDKVQERDQFLRNWNETLNERVEARTCELKRTNKQLEAATKQLIMSEKLAAIGKISAGVAHEINNPIAVIQGNLDVLRTVLGNKADEVRTEIRLIDEQIHRIHIIITKLLQFARPGEYVGDIDQCDPAQVIADCLPLIQHLLKNSEITVHQNLHATRMVSINNTNLQQVLVNLIVNAIHAMPIGGKLTLRNFDSERNGKTGIVIEVMDTGIGMTDRVRTRIFDPFFTTKKRDGTGLGLSICQQLISRQGGVISVDSTPGSGTCFSIWLPETT